MAKEKKRKVKARKGAAKKRDVDVQLGPTVEFLQREISESLCDQVFRDIRDNERQRKWSLFALARFWLVVIVDPPTSLSDLLERTRRIDPRGLLPAVEASAQAFFDRAKNLSVTFFAELYARFVERIFESAPATYCREVSHLLKQFDHIVVIDGSRLDKIAHRLKILREEKAAVLPGTILAIYDLCRGFAKQLWFEADAAASEFQRAVLAIECIAPKSLVVGDRLYCSPKLFRALERQGCFGVFRRSKSVKVKTKRKLGAWKDKGASLEDRLVTAGVGANAIELRLIRLKSGGKTHEALTNVLDPTRLSAVDVTTLYPLRWRVERLFHQLKIVLNLNKFYCANPNAVAQQVFAAAMVHAAFRIAQADIARQVDLEPEEISPDKLFPRLALASIKVIEAKYMFERFREANPGKRLKDPSCENLPDTVVALRHILVQRRSGVRTTKGYDPRRRAWTSVLAIEERRTKRN